MLCPRQDAAHGEGQKGVRCRGVRGEEGYGRSIDYSCLIYTAKHDI